MLNILQDDRVRKLYHSGYKRYKPAYEVVVHGTAGGATGNDIISWMLGLKKIYDNPKLHAGKEWEVNRVEQYLKGIGQFHFIIDQDGRITQLYPIDFWVYHSQSSKHDESTIGIELVNPLRKNEGEYTDAQYVSLARLIEEIKQELPINAVTSHSHNAKLYSNVVKTTPCPGNSFKWNKLFDELAINKFLVFYGIIL